MVSHYFMARQLLAHESAIHKKRTAIHNPQRARFRTTSQSWEKRIKHLVLVTGFMKRKSPQQCAPFNLHILIPLVVLLTGVFIALFAMAGRSEAARAAGGQIRSPNHFPLAFPGYVQEAWVARYNAGSDDLATAMAIDSLGNVYVTGASGSLDTYYDYATIKYNSCGQEEWVVRYNGPADGYDSPLAIAVDGSGNVYVTGGSYDSDTFDDYATVKYNSAGQEQWVARYNGPGIGPDAAVAIAVDNSDNVYVTGTSLGSGH